VVTFQPLPNVDAIKALRWVLKSALRKHGLKCTDLHEADPCGASIPRAKDT
jgi:hypothetical protein